MHKLCLKIGFDEKTTEIFEIAADKIMADKEMRNILYDAMESFFDDSRTDFDKYLQNMSEISGIHIYTVNMAFMLMCARPLKYIFSSKGINDEIYYDTLQDLKYKLDECIKMYGVPGTFVPWWYRAVYTRPVVKLGRLEYEIKPLQRAYGKWEKGDMALSCHIPSCGPLRRENVEASLKMAYGFYNIKGDMLLQCDSWMLYPPHYDLFPENSNLRMFYDLFDIIYQQENENFDMWRIFYKDAGELPKTTRLQKNFANYLSSGKKMGTGYGILVFDGKKIKKGMINNA